jgi:hypothetical protein
MNGSFRDEDYITGFHRHSFIAQSHDCASAQHHYMLSMASMEMRFYVSIYFQKKAAAQTV